MDKLKELLQTDTSFSDENFVNRIITEIRKVIEKTNTKSRYSILNFYCDWALHPRKDKITQEMKKILSAVYIDMVKDIYSGWGLGGPNIKQFTYMENLKQDIERFFKKNNNQNQTITSNENWQRFVLSLSRILVTQPIYNPTPEIERVEFMGAAEGCAIWVVYFNKEIKSRNGKEYIFYRTMNAF